MPSTRADGSALPASELTSYEIYYTTDTAATGTYTVSNGAATSYTVTNLPAGTYYFAMSAVDSAGLKSALSPVVAITFGP